MASSFRFPICFYAAVLLLVNLNKHSVDAIFNDHLESLVNVLHHGEEGGGLGAIFGRGGRNNNKNTSGQDHDSHDEHHDTHERESSRPRGKSRGSQRKPKDRIRHDCDCSGNAALLNELNGIQNAGALNTLVRALVLSRSHQNLGGLGNSLPNLGLGNLNLGNSGLGGLGNSGSHLGLGGLGNGLSAGALNSVLNGHEHDASPGHSGSHLGIGSLGNSGSHLGGLGGLGNGLSAGALNSILNGHGASPGHSVSHQSFGGHGNSGGLNGYGSGLGIFGSHHSVGHSVGHSVPSVPTYNGWTRHVGSASSASHNGPVPGSLSSYDRPKTVYRSGFKKTGVTGGYGSLPAHSNLIEQTATSTTTETIKINDKLQPQKE